MIHSNNRTKNSFMGTYFTHIHTYEQIIYETTWYDWTYKTKEVLIVTKVLERYISCKDGIENYQNTITYQYSK